MCQVFKQGLGELSGTAPAQYIGCLEFDAFSIGWEKKESRSNIKMT